MVYRRFQEERTKTSRSTLVITFSWTKRWRGHIANLLNARTRRSNRTSVYFWNIRLKFEDNSIKVNIRYQMNYRHGSSRLCKIHHMHVLRFHVIGNLFLYQICINFIIEWHHVGNSFSYHYLGGSTLITSDLLDLKQKTK